MIFRSDKKLNPSTLKNVLLPPGVAFIRTVYLIYAVLGTIVLLLSLFVIDGQGMQWLQWAVSITLIWVILYGIFKIKSWVVVLVLIYASFAFIIVLLKFFEFINLPAFDRCQILPGMHFKVIWNKEGQGDECGEG